MKNLAFICLLMLGFAIGHSQSGVNLRLGVGTMVTDQTYFTEEGGAHYGLRLAGFARIGASDTWYFNPGLSYERYNITASSEFDAFDKNTHLHFLKGYVNLAFFLIQTDLFKMRVTGGGNINYLAAIDKNDYDYELGDFNDATLGLNAGIGLDFWVLTFDLGYEQSLTDFFSEPDKSTSRFWTLSAGFFF